MIEDTFYARDRRTWRKWLEDNFRTHPGIWLMFPRAGSGVESVSYSDAVEEAICFGWIDSTIRKHDNAFSKQRFSRRNPRSPFSQLNKERVLRLHAEGSIHASVLPSVEHILSETYLFPQDIIDELGKDPEVWRNYLGFSETYKRIRIAYIDGVRPYPEEFEKRLRYFIRMTRSGKMIVARGTEKYY